MFVQIGNMSINLDYVESIYFKETDVKNEKGILSILTISERYEFEVSYQDWQDLLTVIEVVSV